MSQKFIIGTRKSRLALWQSERVRDMLKSAHPGIVIELHEIVTEGDRTQDSNIPIPEIGGKGLFTEALELALSKREIDFAVHSLKDLPTQMDRSFALGAVCAREHTADVLLSEHGSKFADLPAGSVVGTSSLRRAAQVRRARPELSTAFIRGNVDTRIRKLHDSSQPFDAILLAEAGIRRLGLGAHITEVLPAGLILPAPGQGAMAVQCRSDDARVREVLASIDDRRTRTETTAERAFLHRLNAGCSTPIAALGKLNGSTLRLQVRCLSPDGSLCIERTLEGPAGDPDALGIRAAEQVLADGFDRLGIATR